MVFKMALAVVVVVALIACAVVPFDSRLLFESANRASRGADDGPGPQVAVTQIEWSRDGCRLLARSNGSRFGMGALAICDFDPGTAPRLWWTGCRETTRAAFVAGDASVLVGTSDGAVRRLDLDSAEVQTLTQFPSVDWITAFAATRDGETAAWATNCGAILLVHRGETITRQSFDAGPTSATCLAFSDDGRQLASAGPFGGVQIWDLENRLRVQTLAAHHDVLQEISFLDNGQSLLSCGWDGTLRRWDVALGHEVWRGGRSGETAIYSLAVAPDEALAVTAHDDGRIVFWDIPSGCVLDQVLAHRGAVFTARFSPDGAWLASAGMDGVILVWDVADRSIQAEIDLSPAD